MKKRCTCEILFCLVISLQVLICHGDCDPLVPYIWGQMSSSILKSTMKNLEFKSYKGVMHTTSEEELNDVKQFVEAKLPPV